MLIIEITPPSTMFDYHNQIAWYTKPAFQGLLFYAELTMRDRQKYFRLVNNETNKQTLNRYREHLSNRAIQMLEYNHIDMLHIQEEFCKIRSGADNNAFTMLLRKEELLWSG